VVVEGVVFGQALLDGDELPPWALLEGDEEEPGVELSCAGVIAVRVRVAAAEEALVAVCLTTGEAYVRVGRDHRRAARFSVEVDGVVFVVAPKGCAALFLTSDRALLFFEAGCVPDVEEHPYAARHKICPATQPRGACVGSAPDESAKGAGIVRLDVVGSVLEAHQVARRRRGVTGGRRRSKSRLGPAHRDGGTADPRKCMYGVECDLWVIRACLDAKVAAGFGWVEVLAPKWGERFELWRLARAESESVAPVVFEERRAESERDRQARCRQTKGFAGVDRRLISSR
jgi:hypothetical protein